jgi:hypothetical protein
LAEEVFKNNPDNKTLRHLVQGSMQCKYRTGIGTSGRCQLRLYGGACTNGNMKRCIGAGQNNPEYAKELFARAERAHPSNRPRISGCCDRADQA